MKALDLEQLIRELALELHPEGGYYRRTFQADHRDPILLEQFPQHRVPIEALALL